jgi:hypothetical protein
MNTLCDLVDNTERAGQQHGGEYHAPECPWCGRGEDRLVVWPEHSDHETGKVWCRHCESGCDGLEYAREFCGMTWSEACSFFGVDPEVSGDGRTEGHEADSGDPEITVERPPEDTSGVQWKPYSPPGEQWREGAQSFARSCKDRLWTDEPAAESARDYLHGRGFNDHAIESSGLGVNPKDRWVDRSEWGLDGDGTIWLPRGVVIPWADSEGVSSINIRRPAGDVEPEAEEQWKRRKYQRAAGPSAPLYGVQWTNESPIVLVEGEFDALAVRQEAADVCRPVATGSTGGARRKRWRRLLAEAPAVLVAFDAEEPGEEAARTWKRALPNAIRWRPHAGDTSEMLSEGMNVRMWVLCGIQAAQETVDR